MLLALLHHRLRSYAAPMYVNVAISHYRANEEGEMEPDPEMAEPRTVHEKVFLAKVGGSSICVISSTS